MCCLEGVVPTDSDRSPWIVIVYSSRSASACHGRFLASLAPSFPNTTNYVFRSQKLSINIFYNL